MFGLLLFPDETEMRLGFFFTGCSPSGGASNVFAALLNANLELSLTMTSICTLGALVMMPIWLFTLGRVIFQQGDLAVPYARILMYAASLLIPLTIGFLIRKYLMRLGLIMKKILKPFTTVLTVATMALALAAHWFIFKLFTWKVST